MEYVSEEELEQFSWESIAKTYASEDGQKLLHDMAVEKTKAETEDE